MTALLLAAMVGQAIRPPMHRAWTHVSGERTEILAVRNGIAYFNSRQRTGALTLRSGMVLWERRRPDWAMCSAIDGRRIYVSTSSLKQGRLLSYELRDGKERALRNVPDGTNSFVLWKNRICLLLPERKLVAFDADTRKVLWQTSVGDGKRQRGVSLDEVNVCGDVLVLALDDIGWQCVDPASGKTLWNKKSQYATNDRPTFIRGKVLLDNPQLALVEPRTGREVWKRPELRIEFFGISSNVLIAESEGSIVGVDLKTGRTLWSNPGGRPGFSAGSDRPMWIGDAGGVLVCHEQFTRITPTGKVLWTSPVFFDGWPAFAGNDAMLSSDGDRVLYYVPGEYAKVPDSEDGRRRFAERGVREFEMLDRTEKEQVKGLAKYAAEPLIRRFVGWAKAQQVRYDREDSIDDELGMLWHSLLQDTAKMLDQMCGPEHTPALLKAIQELDEKNSYRSSLVAILGRRGKPDDFIDKYVQELRANPPERGSSGGGGQTLQSVAESRHPAAVTFMIEALKNPVAPEDWRHQAFTHLAGTGGNSGVAAVREARAMRKARATWEDLIDVAGLKGREIVSELKDSHGSTWRLFRSGSLGNYSDLFVSRKEDKGWDKPLFLGVFTERTWSRPAPKDYRGVPSDEFTKSEWINIVPDDPMIRLDTDRDGLTDVAEQRLGTDPKIADTDADGLQDSVDPCPNAAPRPIGDVEKIIAACVEARFFDMGWGVPAMISVEGVKPFELYGYQHPILWQTPDYKGDLPTMYNTGVNMLSFLPYRSSFEENAQGKTPVQISADGKSATTLISRYSGGLNGDGTAVRLIKVGEDWLVVSLVTVYVS